MSEWMNYMVQSALSSVVLFIIYWVLLRKETFFGLIRAYLLGIMVFSSMLPLVPFTNPFGEQTSYTVMLPEMITGSSSGFLLSNRHSPAPGSAILLIYLAGVLFFLSKFLIKTGVLVGLLYRGKGDYRQGFRVFKTKPGTQPFSFFHAVFLPDGESDPQRRETILIHELIHARQWHSLDILLAEIWKIFFWFNPITCLTTRELRKVHEYLADRGVLNSGVIIPLYKQMILEESMGFRVNYLTHPFNVSLVKKRIIMMTKIKSGKWAGRTAMFAFPAAILLVLLISSGEFVSGENNSVQAGFGPSQTAAVVPVDQEQEVKSKSSAKVADDGKAFKKVEKMPSFQGGQEALIKYLQANIRYPEEAKKKGITGTVFVSFMVKADGSVSNAQVVKGVGGGCNEEAIRVVAGMPPWNPGMNKGKPVDVMFTLPIKFMLDGKKKEEPSGAYPETKPGK